MLNTVIALGVDGNPGNSSLYNQMSLNGPHSQSHSYFTDVLEFLFKFLFPFFKA